MKKKLDDLAYELAAQLVGKPQEKRQDELKAFGHQVLSHLRDMDKDEQRFDDLFTDEKR